MNTLRSPLCAALLALFLLPSCKSKLEKCNSVCDKMLEEDEAKCLGGKSCLADASERAAACLNLCDTALGDKSKKDTDDDDKPSKKTSKKSKDSDDEEGTGTSADKDERACDKKDDPEGCANTAARYLLGKDGRSKDESKAVPIAKKACDLDSAFGCELYARALDDGRGVVKDPKGAHAAFTKACEKKSGGACRSLSLRLKLSDPARIPLLQKACDLDDGIGCMGLGAAYLHGNQGAPKDLVKAKQFLQKSCSLGQKSACEKVAEIP